MTASKKRLSKSAREALKILEASKLLKDSKTTNEKNERDKEKPTAGSNPKTSTANKSRPEKKRG
jgi:hypothetical protein